MAKKKRQLVKPVDVYPKVIETFRKIGDYELNGYSFNNKEPSSFNGNVSFKKYRVTVEIIDEPIEVYQERLEKLWVECNNYHQWGPLEYAAAEIGYTFKGERGSQRKNY
jgi:hypothetical protein